MDIGNQEDLKWISGKTLPEVELVPELKEYETLIANTCEYFFKGNFKMNSFPFKGFILEGPPGTGKTEIIKQVVRKLDKRINNVFFLFIDGSTIAAPKWGEAEKRLKDVFNAKNKLKNEAKNPKLIILFDDIESLMISRGAELAKEWHYSINSILFHEMDLLNPTDTIICATTNRIDLVDDAIKTRLYPITVNNVTIDSLNPIITEILDVSIQDEKDKDFVKNKIMEELRKHPNPTLRDARQITVVECIKSGVWSI